MLRAGLLRGNTNVRPAVGRGNASSKRDNSNSDIKVISHNDSSKKTIYDTNKSNLVLMS